MKIKSLLNKFSSKGFTLIELLIVIAILGILAAGVLVAIDPVEQLARGRDAGRKSSVAQLGRAIQANFTANNVFMPVAGWTNVAATNTLVVNGDIRVFPTNPGNPTAPGCTGAGFVAVANNFCYKTVGAPIITDIVVYTHVESRLERNRGTCAGVDANTWYVYSSADGRAGTVCGAAEPAPGLQTFAP